MGQNTRKARVDLLGVALQGHIDRIATEIAKRAPIITAGYDVDPPVGNQAVETLNTIYDAMQAKYDAVVGREAALEGYSNLMADYSADPDAWGQNHEPYEVALENLIIQIDANWVDVAEHDDNPTNPRVSAVDLGLQAKGLVGPGEDAADAFAMKGLRLVLAHFDAYMSFQFDLVEWHWDRLDAFPPSVSVYASIFANLEYLGEELTDARNAIASV